MERLALLVEQLDRAADEFSSKNPIDHRLALILIDNACELMIHQKCESLVLMDRPSWIGEPKYSKSDRQRALGQDFDKKVSFLEKHSIIKSDEAEFLKAAHSLRNPVYHIGMVDDDICGPVSSVYYKLACNLIPRLDRGFRSLSAEPESLGRRFAKHLPEMDDDLWFLHFKDEELSDSLLRRVPQEGEQLGQILCKKLNDELDELAHQIEFLVKDDPRKPSEEDAILDAQISFEEMRLSEKLPFPHEPDYSSAYRQMRDDISAMFKPKFEAIPFKSWRKSAERISQEKSPFRALEKFSSLRREKADISEAIRQASFELDGWIQSEIDRFRGK